jgi:hypothetical protein
VPAKLASDIALTINSQCPRLHGTVVWCVACVPHIPGDGLRIWGIVLYTSLATSPIRGPRGLISGGSSDREKDREGACAHISPGHGLVAPVIESVGVSGRGMERLSGLGGGERYISLELGSSLVVWFRLLVVCSPDKPTVEIPKSQA